MNGKELANYIFLFEELENNLHPSLERRVLKYIDEISQKGAIIFLTTHSNTVLDSFQNSDNVQMYHVRKENKLIQIKTLNNIIGKKGCLDDLGIKASDILQSNGIIWVEGPSDRIYINKWIELWSNGRYKEGMNYQCVFYGGRLLSNTTFEEDNIENHGMAESVPKPYSPSNFCGTVRLPDVKADHAANPHCTPSTYRRRHVLRKVPPAYGR